MKTILLLRHAKAEHGADGPRDFDRTLTPRGRDDAARMGRALSAIKAQPNVIVASPATRAKETAELAAKAMGFSGAIRFERALYDASGPAWIEALRALSDGADSALVVAHSPGIAEAAALLCGADPGTFDIPTAGLLAFVDGAEHWRRVGGGGAVLRWFLRPKLLEHL